MLLCCTTYAESSGGVLLLLLLLLLRMTACQVQEQSVALCSIAFARQGVHHAASPSVTNRQWLRFLNAPGNLSVADGAPQLGAALLHRTPT